MKVPNADHPITITALPGRLTVRFDGAVIADTEQALKLEEAKYPAVFYIPRSAIEARYFERTEHSTYCPYKGDASYFSLKNGSVRAENAVWTYETPYPAMAEIKEYVAFYADKVEFDIVSV